MMRRFYFLFLGILLFSSCTFLVFDKPQPVNATELKSIPGKYTGVYTGKSGDTAFIVTPDSILTSFMGSYIVINLDDSEVVLRNFKHWYVINIKDSTGYWSVYPVKVKGNKIKVYDMYFMSDDSLEQVQYKNYFVKNYGAKLLDESAVLISIGSNKEFFKLLRDKGINSRVYYRNK